MYRFSLFDKRTPSENEKFTFDKQPRKWNFLEKKSRKKTRDLALDLKLFRFWFCIRGQICNQKSISHCKRLWGGFDELASGSLYCLTLEIIVLCRTSHPWLNVSYILIYKARGVLKGFHDRLLNIDNDSPL